MSGLPDELWRSIMEIGIETKSLDYKNLCCLSITCRRLRRLAAEDSLWSRLLLSDFPSSSVNNINSGNGDMKIGSRNSNYASPSTSSSKAKSLYQIRYCFGELFNSTSRFRLRKKLPHFSFRYTVLRSLMK